MWPSAAYPTRVLRVTALPYGLAVEPSDAADTITADAVFGDPDSAAMADFPAEVREFKDHLVRRRRRSASGS